MGRRYEYFVSLQMCKRPGRATQLEGTRTSKSGAWQLLDAVYEGFHCRLATWQVTAIHPLKAQPIRAQQVRKVINIGVVDSPVDSVADACRCVCCESCVPVPVPFWIQVSAILAFLSRKALHQDNVWSTTVCIMDLDRERGGYRTYIQPLVNSLKLRFYLS